MKISNVLVKIMLAIFFVFMAGSMAVAFCTGLSNYSYLVTMVVGFAASTAFYFLSQKISMSEYTFIYQRLGIIKTAAILTALCMLVNLAWIFFVRIEPFSDYMNFWQCACDMAAGRPLTDLDFIALFPHIMGYSSFLSLFISAFGENALLAPILNVILTCISGLLIFIICLRYTGFKAAIVAYLLWIFFPSKLMLNSVPLSEPLYTCLILLFVFIISEVEQQDNPLGKKPIKCLAWGILLGVVLRAINIVRPLSFILIVAFFIWVFMLRGGKLKCSYAWRTWLITALAMLCVYYASGLVWKEHEEAVLGEEPASFPIYNIYVGFNGETEGQWNMEDMQLLLSYKAQEGATANSAQKSMEAHLLERLKTGDIDYAALFASKLFAFAGNDELGGYTYRFTRSESFVKVCMLICNTFYYGVMLLALVGLVVMFRKKINSGVLIVPLYALGLTMAHMLLEVTNRYHYSTVPMLIIIASFAITKSEKLIDKESERA